LCSFGPEFSREAVRLGGSDPAFVRIIRKSRDGFANAGMNGLDALIAIRGEFQRRTNHRADDSYAGDVQVGEGAQSRLARGTC